MFNTKNTLRTVDWRSLCEVANPQPSQGER